MHPNKHTLLTIWDTESSVAKPQRGQAPEGACPKSNFLSEPEAVMISSYTIYPGFLGLVLSSQKTDDKGSLLSYLRNLCNGPMR